MDKILIEVPHATLDFYKYEKDDLVYYEFNAVECTPPEPMVNTMSGLQMLKKENERLIGTFFHEPFPLYQRISVNFEYKSQELKNGDFLVVFKRK